MVKFTILALFASGIALAFPFDNSDLSNSQTEGKFLRAMPEMKFSVDDRLKKNVDFWVRVYTQYTSQQGLIHDAKYIDHVYEVLDFRNSGKSNSGFIKNTKRKWKAVLLSVHRKQNTPDKMTEDEKYVFQLFRDVNEPNKFLNAAHRRRLRFQLGQKDCFLDGLHNSGLYLSMMEEIFKREGMPVELTRLPFVESSFNIRARSKVGASGIWQFMRSTARLFIKVNAAVDERNDPIRATEAAAKLLKLNYESLKSWPLAVTAYNHGRKGVMRAVRRVGSDDLEDVVSEYHSRTFGFASSNFFTELLAAIEVEKNAEKYFGKVELAKPTDSVELKIPDFVEIKVLSRYFKWDLKMIQSLNPALTDAVYSGSLFVPAGYKLRIPSVAPMDKESAERIFLEGYANIPDRFKYKTQRSLRYERRTKSVMRNSKTRSQLWQTSDGQSPG